MKIKIFPEIDITAATETAQGLTPSQQTHRSTIQGNYGSEFPEISQFINKVTGIAVASYNVGCFCGAIATILIGNPLGRRKTIFLGSSIMIIGATLQASSYSLGQFISGRIITGYEYSVQRKGKTDLESLALATA